MNRKVQPLLRAGMTYLDHMPIDTGSTSKLPCSVRYDIDWVVSLPSSLLSLSLSLPFIFYFYSYFILFYFFFSFVACFVIAAFKVFTWLSGRISLPLL